MASPASIQKHPIHPMLIPFPIALWIFSLVCDLIYAMGWGTIIWNDMAFYTMVGGMLGALAAAIPGYIDYRSLIDPQATKIGRWHMLINLSIVVLFAINLSIRMWSEPGAVLPILLSFIGIAMLGVSGWLGGELVYVHGVAVEPEPRVGASPKERSRAV
ncbi:MAG: DUF2231 domain-containing protein [Nitrospirota bacterium]|nr:DUF2231 domain-containing protein [Nitrospirota bacterium]